MTPHVSRYGAAVSTYRTRPAFKVIGALIAIDLFIITMFALGARLRYDFNFGGFFGVVFEAVLITALFGPFVLFVVFVAHMMQHLREQLFQSRAALIPGFIRAHLAVGYTMLVAIPVIGMVAIVAAGHLLEPQGESFPALLGPVALLLFALAVTAWMASFRSPWLALLVLPLSLLTLAVLSTSSWRAPRAFKHLIDMWPHLLPVLLLVVDIFLLAGLFARLSVLSGRDPDDSKRLLRTRHRPPTSVRIQLRPHRALSSPLVRAWHRRSGIISPLAPWVVALSLGSLLLIVTSVFGGESSDQLHSVLLPTLVPGVVISLIWRERWMNLGYESLYPAGREQFLQELLGATAISLAELWLATAVAVIPPILIHSPHLLTSPMFLVTLAASAAMQFLVFGIMFLSALFRPMLPYVNVITILAQLIPIAYALADRPELSQRGLLTVAGFEMLIGILITTYGYRTWRRADLA